MHFSLLLAAAIAAVALPTNEIFKRTNNNYIFSTLTTNSFVGSASCSLGSPSVCIGRSSLALIQYFFNGYQATVDTLKRDNLEENVFHPIGNSSVEGVHLLYIRSGNMHGIRAIDADTLEKRTSKDESKQGGFVGDFYWHAPNQQAYNSFHSTSSEIQNVANLLTSYVLKYSSIESCVDFGDSDGELNSGVVTFGWNNSPFAYSSQSALEQRLNTDCIVGQILHDGKNVQQGNI